MAPPDASDVRAPAQLHHRQQLRAQHVQRTLHARPPAERQPPQRRPPHEHTAAAAAPAAAGAKAGADGGLKDVKITVSGDRVSGMNGDETVYGPATVTGTKVVFSKEKKAAPSVSQTHSNGVSITDDKTVMIDGVPQNIDLLNIHDRLW